MESLKSQIEKFKNAKEAYKAYSKFIDSQIKPLKLRGNVRYSVITALEEGSARTGGTQGSGKWSKSYRNGYSVVNILKTLGVSATVHNDAPRGGADGEYVVAELTGDFSSNYKHELWKQRELLQHEFKALKNSIDGDINDYFQRNKELWSLIAPFFGGKIKNFINS